MSTLNRSDFFSQEEQWGQAIHNFCLRVQAVCASKLAEHPYADVPISETALRSCIGGGHAFASLEDLKSISSHPIKKDFKLDAMASASLNGYVEAAIRNATLRPMYHLEKDDKLHIGATISLGDLQREAGYKLISQDAWRYVMANYPFPPFMNVDNHDNCAWTLWWYTH